MSAHVRESSAAALALLALLALGFSGSEVPTFLSFRLVDVTAQAGIRFLHYNGAFGKKYLPETLGSGCAFLDFDNDGWQDVLLVSGTDWPGRRRRQTTAGLYLNSRNGTFSDVTKGSGLDVPLYGMGVAVGDYDNDGLHDIFISCVGQSRLFRNNGKGRFSDVTASSGLGGRSGFSTSALWLDYDRDGLLDLFVCNYVKWSPERDIFCSLDGKVKSYCTPEAYRGSTCWLFRNRGRGLFEDVTATSGLFDSSSKSLGVTMLDYDLDGWPDLFISNDTQPNKLYRNNRNGTFTEVAAQAGLALSEDGKARAGMGVDSADYDNSGLPGVVVTNFSREMLGLYQPVGEGLYVDQAPRSNVGRISQSTLGFGCFFFDVDLDSRVDLLVVNGHIDDAIARVQSRIQYAQPPHLFQNLGAASFRDVAPLVGSSFAQPKVGRGAAFGDFDNDGDSDVLITTNAGPAYLYRTEVVSDNQAVRFRLRGSRSNRDGIGARIQLFVQGSNYWKTVKSGSSYLSQSELPVTFGLGRRAEVDKAVVYWPSGHVEELKRVKAGFSYEVLEANGIVAVNQFKN